MLQVARESMSKSGTHWGIFWRILAACRRAHRSDAVLHVVCGVCMRRPIGHSHLRVVLGLLVRVWHHDADGGAQRDAITNTCKDKSSTRQQSMEEIHILLHGPQNSMNRERTLDTHLSRFHMCLTLYVAW